MTWYNQGRPWKTAQKDCPLAQAKSCDESRLLAFFCPRHRFLARLLDSHDRPVAADDGKFLHAMVLKTGDGVWNCDGIMRLFADAAFRGAQPSDAIGGDGGN
jgi:hypothetical protein